MNKKLKQILSIFAAGTVAVTMGSVSYTHLDVYKRQEGIISLRLFLLL